MRKKGSQPSRRSASPNLMDGKEPMEQVHGNSMALVIDKPILDMLQITANEKFADDLRKLAL